jgi:hypothetical protein
MYVAVFCNHILSDENKFFPDSARHLEKTFNRLAAYSPASVTFNVCIFLVLLETWRRTSLDLF